MPDENLLKYVKDGLAMGRSEDVIRSMLASTGWAQKDVDDAFSFAKGGQPTPPTPPPTNKNFSAWRWVVFAIILVIVIAAGAFIFVKAMTGKFSQSVPNATSTPAATPSSSDPYAGWATYKDSTGLFSILYPPQYKVQQKLIFTGVGEADIYAVSAPTTPLVSVSYSPAGSQTPQTALASAMKNILAAQKKTLVVTYTTSTATIAGDISAQALSLSGENSDGAIYYFNIGGTLYQIVANFDAGSSTDVASNKTLAENIIATFKTISPSATPTNTDWQSYTDAQFGVTFPYPPGYLVQSSLVIGDSEDISIRPTDEPQLSGIILVTISISPQGTDSPQTEIAKWTKNFQYASGYAISTSTVTVAGNSATKFSIVKSGDNGAIYIFGAGKYTYVITANYDHASSAQSSPSSEADNKAAIDRILQGLVVTD